MRLLPRALLLLLAALPLAALALLALALQDQPLVSGAEPLTPDDVARLRQVFRAQDPRRAGGTGLRTASVGEKDLALAANYLAGQFGGGAARVTVRPGAATLQASLEAPSNPFGRYVNIDAAFRQAGQAPEPEHLRIGRVPLPRFAADWLLAEALRRLAATDAAALAGRITESVRFGDGTLTVAYRWSDEIAAQARSSLVAPEDRQRLRAYQEQLAEVVATAPHSLSVAALLPPLFRLALERGADGDVAQENRAAIVVLALYATGRPLQRIVADAAAWRQPARRTVTLSGREDFPLHFLVSAAIAAEAGSPLADAVGLHKEIEDARRGSGFSFNDIGANRAGTRFGELATGSPRRALRLARALAAGVAESDFMPDVSDLPEFMPEAEFRRRFGGVDSAQYAKVIATIDGRIDALPLLRR